MQEEPTLDKQILIVLADIEKISWRGSPRAYPREDVASLEYARNTDKKLPISFATCRLQLNFH
jgi:hypothetical protein